MRWRDELGEAVEVERHPERIVSLVPSLTETLFALGLGDKLVGVTRFCVEPQGVVTSLPKVGGTKNPDLRAIAELAPDLVIANAEENRRKDVERLRQQGIAVFVTYPRSVAAGVRTILGLGRLLGRGREASLLTRRIVRVVSNVETSLGIWNKLRFKVFCPIWKNPWMTFNQDTYAHDVLRLMGFSNVFAGAGQRYPRTTLDEALELGAQIVLLPDEPYRFDDSDVAEIKAMMPRGASRRLLLISGRDLHWYGAHMVHGLPALNERLARLRAALL